jgi:threonine/homoserine/homoserine lactone efflux protein
LDLSALLIFAGALLLAAGSPGPSIAALVARVIARGWRDVLPFAAAMWLGESLWLTLAVYGLAALAETLHGAFLVLKYLGAGYLLYLAWKMWHAPVAPTSHRSASASALPAAPAAKGGASAGAIPESPAAKAGASASATPNGLLRDAGGSASATAGAPAVEASSPQRPASRGSSRSGSGRAMFLAGLAVTLGNPKIMVFYLALLPTIIDLAGITLLGWLELTATMLVILAAIDLGYIALAARARLLLKSPRALRIANRASATLLGGAAATLATQ